MYEWNGTAWTSITSSVRFGANARAVFDVAQGTIVAYGGTAVGMERPTSRAHQLDTWNGSVWTYMSTTGAAFYDYDYEVDANPADHHWAVTYDQCQNSIVLYAQPPGSSAAVNQVTTTGYPYRPPVFAALPAQQVWPGDP